MQKRLFIALLGALVTAGCSGESVEKLIDTGAVGAFATQEEAQDFVETELAEVVAATLAASKLAVLDHVGQVSTATAAPAFSPMAVLALGDPIDFSFSRPIQYYTYGYAGGYDTLAGTFSGAVTDVDTNGKRYGHGAFAKGTLDATLTQVIKYGTRPGTYVLSLKGEAVYALSGQDTDNVTVDISGATSFRGYDYNIDVKVTVASGQTVISGEVGGQSVTEVPVKSDATDSSDTDRDSVRNDIDNCPAAFNFNQADLDGDGDGDACDDDADADSIPRDNDCNDLNASVYPGATETPSNGVDEDCSGADLVVPVPDTTIEAKPAASTAVSDATFTFTCTEASCTFECKLDAGAFAECTSPKSYTGLLAAQHTFQVRATGNSNYADATPAKYAWTVVPPDTTLEANPATSTNQSDATFTFACSVEGCTFECKLDNGAYATCTSPKSYAGLDDGGHDFYVRAKEPNLDATPVHFAWTIDSTPPDTQISTVFETDVTTTAVSLAFSCSGETAACTFECAYNTDQFTACTSPLTVEQSEEGYQYLWVRASDAAGNIDETPAYRAWTFTVPGETSPTDVTTTVAAGEMHSCAVDLGELFCWGADDNLTPIRIGIATDWFGVYAGDYHTCALRTDKQLYCWGNNVNYQLGTGDDTDRDTPTLIASGSAWQAISPGSTHTCGVKTDGTLWCWGDNGVGQVGNGSTLGGDVTMPTQIGTDTDWASVSATYDHSCAVKSGGTLYCWGYNNMGQLGTGNTTQQFSPVQTGTDTDWSTVVVAGSHTCALKTGGELYCWGDNGYDQLGVGYMVYPEEPQQVGTATWKAVATAYDHTCGVQTDGTLWCWGDDSTEELGNGTFDGSQSAPSQVGVETDWASVAAGYGHTLGIRGEHDVYGWGDNTSGQVGDQGFPDPMATGVAEPSLITPFP